MDELLDWVKANSAIVTTILMQCGPTTKSGPVAGALSPACKSVIPRLAKLGVGSELWLGETDNLTSALALFEDTTTTVDALLELGRSHPGIVGFNFDLEVSGPNTTVCGKSSCAERYTRFLGEVRAKLAKSAKGTGRQTWRVTADASCSQPGAGWAPVISNCSLLANGADLLMNMATYNAPSYNAWLSQLGPSVDDSSFPRTKLGAGLGCWIEHRHGHDHAPATAGKQPVPAWSLTPKSAEQRVCELMNRSVLEIDMFRLKPPDWPEPW